MPVNFDVLVAAPRMNPLLATLVLGDLAAVSRQWALDLRAEVRKYPSPRPGQSYRRTFRLKNAWKIQGPALLGPELVTSVTNDTPYATKVFGDSQGNGQPWFHQGRWRKQLALATSVIPLQRRAQAALNLRMGTAFVTESIRIT